MSRGYAELAGPSLAAVPWRTGSTCHPWQLPSGDVGKLAPGLSVESWAWGHEIH